MERYSEYKDSGVKWLGEIPSHWEVEPFGRHFSFRKGLPITKANLIDSGEAVISYGQIHAKENLGTTMSESLVRYVSRDYLKSHPQCLLTKDDFVFADTSEDIGGSGNFVYNDFPANIFAGYHTIVAKQSGLYNPSYYAYLFKSECWRNHIRSLVNGVKVYSIGRKQLKSNFLLFPSYKEQDSIVRYLDAATTKIDKAIDMQQKMIDLLNERKQIIIQNAVTKGLDENVEMKDSGVEWIGMIPKHWEIMSFRHIINVLTDYTANGSFGDLAANVKYLDSKDYARLVRLTDLRNNFDEEKGVWVNQYSYEYLAKSELHGGELLIANVGAYSGLPWVMPNVQFKATLAPNMFMLKLKDVKTEYIYYLVSSTSFFKHLQMIASATAQPKINKNNIRALNIVLPPLEEQQAIVSYLDKEMQHFDSAITNCQRQISLLQERKQIIINEVVTGKVKVS